MSLSDEFSSNILDLSEKIVIIGDVFVGKTSLLFRFKNNIFSEDVKSTLGYDSFEHEITLENGKIVRLWIWDTAGSERFRGTVSLYYKNAKAVIVVFDLTNRDSFDKIQKWKTEVDNHSEENVVVFLVGNKLDLVEDRKVN